MTVHFMFPRGGPRPRVVAEGLEKRALRRAAEASLLGMASVIQQLREAGRHDEADVLTRQRDEWFRATTAAVEATGR